VRCTYFGSVLLVLLDVAGCVSYSNLKGDTAADPNSQDAIVVMGLQPRYRVAIARGSINAEGRVRVGGMATLNVFPEDGYVVGRVPAASSPDEYHLQLILPQGIGAFVPAYFPCGDERVLTFEAPPGKVLYVGDVEFSTVPGKLELRYRVDIDGAKIYVKEHYPRLVDRLEPAAVKFVPIVHLDCGPKHIVIPVTVYRG
jgi:hypothetical protein